jgi:DNA-3-methyladenine glycosylase II
MPFYAQHIKAARLQLQKSDPVMKRIIKLVGPFHAKTKRDRFGTLVSSIVSQQISVAAARTINTRLLEATSDSHAAPKFTPEGILKFDVDGLRGLGVSRQKASYVLDLAEKVDSGVVELEGLHRQSDDDVIEVLTQVKGIGIWTAQMFLMFSLGRLDIFPYDDLGIKNAIARRYELGELPSKSKMLEISTPWRPYSTVACWYLWQSLDLEDD